MESNTNTMLDKISNTLISVAAGSGIVSTVDTVEQNLRIILICVSIFTGLMVAVIKWPEFQEKIVEAFKKLASVFSKAADNCPPPVEKK